MKKTYYVATSTVPGKYDLRQTRYIGTARLHPNDVVAAGFDRDELLAAIDRHFGGRDNVDMSAMRCAPPSIASRGSDMLTIDQMGAVRAAFHALLGLDDEQLNELADMLVEHDIQITAAIADVIDGAVKREDERRNYHADRPARSIAGHNRPPMSPEQREEAEDLS